MTLYVKDTDIEIVGTLEALKGVARADGLTDEGQIVWHGETDVWWDEQETILIAGRPIWVDAEGKEYQGVDVVDRRPDGTVALYKPLADDIQDELVDLLNQSLAKSNSFIEHLLDIPANETRRSVIKGVQAQIENSLAGLSKLNADG